MKYRIKESKGSNRYRIELRRFGIWFPIRQVVCNGMDRIDGRMKDNRDRCAYVIMEWESVRDAKLHLYDRFNTDPNPLIQEGKI